MNSSPSSSSVHSTKVLSSIILLLLCILPLAYSDDHSHKYEISDEVTFWFNKIGPYHNPQETYAYYSLPFCRPTQHKNMKETDDSLGVILEGDELTDSGLFVQFRKDIDMKTICELTIDKEAETIFLDAVQNHYWYQMYIDELPVWGMVGEVMAPEPSLDTKKVLSQSEAGFIYTHKEFTIAYNRNQIIEVNLTSENPRQIQAGKKYPMTFSVKWTATTKPFESRFDRYLDFDFFEHQIHWFSIFNSFMMVIFLCGLVALILMRTLRNDYARFSMEDEDLELERVVDESGWKQIHGDVFRAPRYLSLFASIVGSGAQMFVLVLSIIIITLFATLYDDRGSLTTAFLVLYSLTSICAGYVSAAIYKRFGGTNWKRNMLITACLYPSFCFGLCFFLNLIAVSYQSSASLSFGTFFLILCIFFFISVPLTLFGTIMGRSLGGAFDFPCRVNALPRPIPDAKWYVRPLSIVLFAGILPFGSIFIEMYFIFTSFWNYKFYYVYGFMFLVFLILIIVSVCVTIVSTYVLLNAEDYRWHWTSFASSASTAVYVFLYAVYYFFSRTHMSGVMQTSFYFGYMAMFCVALGLLCGTIGFFGANIFVWKIYRQIKSD
jgi:transmembrane 9 superfamily protein 3